MSDSSTHAVAVMGTVVLVRVVGPVSGAATPAWRQEHVERALAWFQNIEAVCSRFEPESEVTRLCRQWGRPVLVSALLYQVVEYALAVAEASGGAFDPTVGRRMETRGFNRNWRTGRTVDSRCDPHLSVSFRDIRLDATARTIELTRPLVLDLGAVAKGLAIDMAAQELLPLENFMIDAGGDVYVRGTNEKGHLWSIGIRHPHDEEVIETVRVTDMAVCTSGDYERRTEGGQHHILDPRTGASTEAVASVSVLAPSAMAADALSTAAFVLGPSQGLELLEREGVDGLILTPALDRFTTPGWSRHLLSSDSVAEDASAGLQLP